MRAMASVGTTPAAARTSFTRQVTFEGAAASAAGPQLGSGNYDAPSDGDVAAMLRVTVFSLERHVAHGLAVGSVSPEFQQSLLHARGAIDLMLHKLHGDSTLSQVSAAQSAQAELEGRESESTPPHRHGAKLASADRKPAADGSANSQDGEHEELGIQKSAESAEPSLQHAAARLFHMFDDPSSGDGAGAIAVVSLLILLLSVLLFVWETDPHFWRDDKKCEAYKKWAKRAANDATNSDLKPVCEPTPPHAMKNIELACIIFFTAEYAFRLFTAWSVPVLFCQGTDHASTAEQHEKQSSLYRTLFFVRHPMNIIDLLAVVPFWVETCSPGTRFGKQFVVLRLLRMTRMFRVLKFGKYNYGLRFIGNVLYNSMSAFFLLLFFVFILSIISGSLIYYAERGYWSEEDGQWKRSTLMGFKETEPSPFYSIPRSLWWVVVTITTVGYGDFYPTTILGKCVGFFTVISSVLLLALPVTIIGSEFSIEYDQSLKEGHSKLFALPEHLDFHMPEALQRRLPRKSRLVNLFDVVTKHSTMSHRSPGQIQDTGVRRAAEKFLRHKRARDAAQAAAEPVADRRSSTGRFTGFNPRFSVFQRSNRMPGGQPAHQGSAQAQDSATSAGHDAAADHDQKPPFTVQRKDQSLI